MKVFAITFALISLFLLVAQWACTLRRGMFVQLGLIIVLLNGFVRDVDLTMLLAIEGARPLGWFVAALLGWMLLFLALRRGVIAGPVPSQSIERMSGGNQKSFELGLWQPSFGGAGEPDGSLMRGSNDSLGTRVWQAGIWVLFLSSLMVTFGLLTRNPMLGARGPGITPLFVGASLMSVAVLAPLTLAEWPARLRFLWLRSDGDRGALWSRLERALLEQTVIVKAVAAAAATLLMAVADGDVGLLLAYVAGCAVALPFGGYLGFWLRGRALSFNVFGFVQMLIWTAAFWMAFFLYRSHGVMGLVPLIAGIGVLGVLWRQLAQRQFRGVDWCAVRPVRQRDSRLFPGRRA
jgi:hypothetical protein